MGTALSRFIRRVSDLKVPECRLRHFRQEAPNFQGPKSEAAARAVLLSEALRPEVPVFPAALSQAVLFL